jgi:DNA-binding transcriptional LysR family regulator
MPSPTTVVPIPAALGAAHWPAVAAFAEVARVQSFTKAAVRLGVSTSALSQSVRSLESRIGVRLLNRTTRTVALTEAGTRFLTRVSPALEQFAAAFSDMDEYRDQPAGTLRLSLPRLALATVIAPLLAGFCAAYPQVRLDLVADDRMVDLVGEGFDAGIRFGERLAQDMIAVRASVEQRSVVVGAPAYFARHAPPQVPKDLHAHRCLRFRFASSALYRWEFGRDGEEFDIDVDGPLICNDNALLLDAALQGVGLAHLMEHQVRKALRAGTLVCVLQDWCPPFPGLYLYYPGRRQIPLKLRVFIDFLATQVLN